jgi:hypothetical protein
MPSAWGEGNVVSDEVPLCHYSLGKSHPHTIMVSASSGAISGHLQHYDYLGECQPESPPQ